MSTRQVAEAREVCVGCPVKRDCLVFALINPENWGVWGGYTSAERKRALVLATVILRRKSRRDPEPLDMIDLVVQLYDSDELSAMVIKR